MRELSQVQIRNREIKSLDPITAIAIVWSSIVMGGTVHGFNGGTNEDQVKILMINEYNHKSKTDLTIDEILDLWNSRKHGKPHTRQQAVNAVQALKAKGHVVVTDHIPGKAGKPSARYALASVLEKETSPTFPVEEEMTEEKTSVITTVETVDPHSMTALILDRLNEMHQLYTNSLAAIIQHLDNGSVASASTERAYNNLVTQINLQMQEASEIHTHNVSALQLNADEFAKFVDRTNSNFSEIESYFKQVEKYLQVGSGQNSNQAYREGYKEGFKDGRKDYRDDLTSSTRAIED